ncbi:signal peptidase I [Paenibacillus filicis]|uniref:Signal peptidase I n=1 Tax=Paenibacillus gyeongsangnamensis TaxID=3388067 RepID=A0ABT4QB89_9BACL|nr:signal peptidase I [Paenibacillus filicis]MCZ8514136.1 signal peptidase I [Paenibacillus filicis]
MDSMSPKKANRELLDPPLRGETESSLLHEALDWFKSIIFAVVVVFLLHHFIFHLSTVKGTSMQPTLEDGEWLFINKIVRITGSVQRGEVVVIQEPTGTDKAHPFLVKRVVAVAGDEISVRSGKLYVNGEEVKETYTDAVIEDGRFEPYTVAKGQIFVMGDNRHRNASYDSRSFGSVPLTDIEGKAQWIVWPLGKWRSL